MKNMSRSLFAWSLVFVACMSAQEASRKVTIEVKADHTLGDWRPIWNYFGYDEPNYTYAENRK